MHTTDKTSVSILKSFSKQVIAFEEKTERYARQEERNRAAMTLPLLDQLLVLYPRVQAHLQTYLQKHRFDKRLYHRTTFEIMKRHRLEETHSNVLAYLLSKQGAGVALLQSMLGHMVPVGLQSAPIASGKGYLEVTREYSVQRKRIDLLVEGDDCVVAIENKYFSRLHDTEESVSQTTFYWKEIEKKFKHKKRHYLILDYKGEEKDENFLTLSYAELLESLNETKGRFLGDRVYEEYVYLLRRTMLGLLNVAHESLADLSLTQLTAIQTGDFR